MFASGGKFFLGVALMAAFLVVLVVMFLPIFDGQNALSFMDTLYNTISKGSAYFIPELIAEAEDHRGTDVSVVLTLAGANQASEAALLLEGGGASVRASGAQLHVSGDLGGLLARCLEDSDEMFANDGGGIRTRYGLEERRALFNWWTVLKEMEKELNRQTRFPEAAFVTKVNMKAVECAYNYYGIEARRISEKLGVVVFSLVFYVIYTVWYGYAIIFMLEGWGLRLSH